MEHWIIFTFFCRCITLAVTVVLWWNCPFFFVCFQVTWSPSLQKLSLILERATLQLLLRTLKFSILSCFVFLTVGPRTICPFFKTSQSLVTMLCYLLLSSCINTFLFSVKVIQENNKMIPRTILSSCTSKFLSAVTFQLMDASLQPFPYLLALLFLLDID